MGDVLLAILGGVMVALMLERYVFFSKRREDAAQLAKKLIEELKGGRVDQAKSLVEGKINGSDRGVRRPRQFS